IRKADTRVRPLRQVSRHNESVIRMDHAALLAQSQSRPPDSLVRGRGRRVSKGARAGPPGDAFSRGVLVRYCQRMDEEAFSDRESMALLNAYFIALRVENAKRPDIDARYNLNGWPTIAFFAPNGKLLAAANYLPGEEFKELLLNVYMEYERRKEDFRAMPTEATAAAANGKIAPSLSQLREITDVILSLADSTNGGYGRGQKFIQAEADEFLLCRYEATGDARCLDAARLTLDRMRGSPIYDENDGGYFRTTTGADWTEPHREKLLGEQAGLLGNCLRIFRLTQNPAYARMAEEIIDYLDRKLFDPG